MNDARSVSERPAHDKPAPGKPARTIPPAQRARLDDSMLGWALLAMLALLLWANVTNAMHERHRALELARLRMEGQLRLAGEHAGGLLQGIDDSLDSLAANVAEYKASGSQVLEVVLHIRRNLLRPHVLQLAYFGSNGRVVAATGPLPSAMLGGAFLTAHRDRMQESAISRLRTSDDSPPKLLISRRVANYDGSYDGVVVILADPQSFRDEPQEADPVEIRCATLVDGTGQPLVSWPPTAPDDCVRNALSTAISDSMTGPAETPAPERDELAELSATPLEYEVTPVGGVQDRLHITMTSDALVGVYRLPYAAFRLIMSAPLAPLLAPWKRQTIANAVFSAMLALAVATLARATSRQREQRLETEAALRRSEARLQEAQHIARTGSFEIDIAGDRAEYWSPGLYALFELDPRMPAMPPSAFCTAHTPDDTEWFQSIVASRADETESPVTRTVPFVTARGRHGVGRLQAVVLRGPDGKAETLRGTFQDITHLHATEQALQRAKDEAESASEVKSQFVANISHEMRTPLSGILGIADVAISRLHGPQAPGHNEEQLRYISMIRNVSEGLLHVINDLLDFSRLEAGRMELDRVEYDLRAAVNDALAPLAVQAERKGLALTLRIDADVPALMRGDPLRLRQVLVNLAGNAVKFTETGSVLVTVRCKKDCPAPGGCLLFSVEDTGPGIAADKIPRLFESFAQADGSHARRHGGSGLGLAISRHIVRMQGGDIGVESVPDSGSRFWFTLPTGRSVAHGPEGVTETALAGSAAAHAAPDPLRVLLAEDNDLNREFLVFFLRERGYRVATARDGQEALDLLRTGGPDGRQPDATTAPPHFDVVLMDVQMPVVSGLEATRRIRQAHAQGAPWADVPIIALTAHAMQGDRDRFLSEGMDDFVAKPVNREALFAAIERQVERCRERQGISPAPRTA